MWDEEDRLVWLNKQLTNTRHDIKTLNDDLENHKRFVEKQLLVLSDDETNLINTIERMKLKIESKNKEA